MTLKNIPFSTIEPLVKNVNQYTLIEKFVKNNFRSDQNYIAGGAIRRMFCEPHQSDKVADVDLFFKDNDHLENVVKYYKYDKSFLNRGHLLEGEFFEQKTQIITKKVFPTISSLFDNFDFTVCCFALHKNNIYFTDKSWKDLENKKLVVNNDVKVQEFRWYKYINMGFIPENNIISYEEDGKESFSYIIWQDDKPLVYKNGQIYSIHEYASGIYLENDNGHVRLRNVYNDFGVEKVKDQIKLECSYNGFV